MAMRVFGFLKKDECDKFYKMGKTLGKGSFAEVKIATHKTDGTTWAVKIIKKQSLMEDEQKSLQDEVGLLQHTCMHVVFRAGAMDLTIKFALA
mmetsp:Transcript_8653/g.25181  ORF Transcript_8653/g.25181 Transcript_8653/m.25181 type:complete len:93 (+) Transcript_8653:112-390(+)